MALITQRVMDIQTELNRWRLLGVTGRREVGIHLDVDKHGGGP